MNVIVIGGGAAGCMSAITSAKLGNNVTLLEKKEDIGKKLKITGKGRCNLTFDGNFEYFKDNIVVNDKFMYSSFNNFNNTNILKFFNNLGVKTKLERGNRYFLESDDAQELVKALKKELLNQNVKIIYNSNVEKINVEENKVKSITVNNKEILCDKCIVATGGKSYSSTGSDGEGYELVRNVGHSIVDIKGGLVGIKSNDKVCKSLQGLTLKNVNITVYDKDKKIYSDFGEMLFTHFGLTGPIILSSSSYINRIENISDKFKNNEIYITIDLKPALSFETLDKRICRDFEKCNNKEFKNSLNELLPQKLISEIVSLSGIEENKKVHQITREEREKLVKLLKDFRINVNGLMSIDTAIVTCGGINTKEINPKTLESKLIKGLYFAGEIIDIDALTGGFNLTIAFSTGVTAGMDL